VPETRGEWLVFVAGLLLIGFLVAAVVYRPENSDPSTTPKPRRVPVHVTVHTSTERPPETTTETAPTSTEAQTTTVTTTAKTAPAARQTIRLRVSARDDTWLSVRRDSSTGDVLFEGTLAKGDSRTFTAKQFSVRFGAAANVAATLNGKALPLPGGTYSATIDRRGLGARSA
jgi:cytoskeletal protein RodZ